MKEQLEIVIVERKDQIVILQQFKKELAITPKTKISVYLQKEKLVAVKPQVQTLVETK
jgi:hypothetical protein